MRDYPVFVSYYTNDDKYAALADRLRNNLNELKLDHHVVSVGHPAGKWSQNASHKPRVLIDVMERYKRPVVWVDVDAVVRVVPGEWCDDRFDFCTYTLSHPWWFMGNFLRFGYTNVGLRMLHMWRANTQLYPKHTDELILTHAFHTVNATQMLRYYVGNRVKLAGVRQDNISTGHRDKGLYTQADLVAGFKSDIEKRRIHRLWTLDEIVITR